MLSQLLLAIDTPEQKTKFENIFNKYNEVMLKIAFSYTKSQYDAEMRYILFSSELLKTLTI